MHASHPERRRRARSRSHGCSVDIAGSDDTADADSDGTPDFCNGCPNEPLKTAPGNGEVDGADFAYVLGYWGICSAS
ncbi:MAG: hypothetical protein GY895_00665 [Phycisphaera sp.]|nr:hypothetical protein [Phycisphaera sp.]